MSVCVCVELDIINYIGHPVHYDYAKDVFCWGVKFKLHCNDFLKALIIYMSCAIELRPTLIFLDHKILFAVLFPVFIVD